MAAGKGGPPWRPSPFPLPRRGPAWYARGGYTRRSSSSVRVRLRATIRSAPARPIYYPLDISLRDRERGDDGTEEDLKGLGSGRIDGVLGVLEHGTRRDAELLGESLRLAVRVRQVPDGRVPLVPHARRRSRGNPTDAGEGAPGEHELRARRRPRRGAKESRAGGGRDRPPARGRPGHGEFLLVPRAPRAGPRRLAGRPPPADGAGVDGGS